MNPDEMRQFVRDIKRGMERRAIDKHGMNTSEVGPSDTSQMKSHYGDAWSFIFGIVKGVNLMNEGEWTERDLEKRETISHGVGDNKWQEHYDKFGYGAHGCGLEIGKRLAFYDGESKFTFVEPSEEESNESQFTFVQ